MNARLGRRPFALIWLLTGVAWWGGVQAAEPDAPDLRRAASELSAADFAVRERAASTLVSAGSRSIEILAESLHSKNPEIVWRSTAVLLQISVEGDDEASRQAISTLRGSPADGAHLDLASVRVKRLAKQRVTAEASIRSLGGLFGSPADPSLTADDGASRQPSLPSQPSPPQELQEPGVETTALLPPPDLSSEEAATLARVDPLPQVDSTAVRIADAYVSPLLPADDALATGNAPATAEIALTLNKTWRGGDEGLTGLRHLPEIVSVRLDHAPVSDAALSHISVLPQLRDMRILHSPFTPAALGRFRQRHPNVTIFVAELAPQAAQPKDQPPVTTTR